MVQPNENLTADQTYMQALPQSEEAYIQKLQAVLEEEATDIQLIVSG